MCTNIPDNFGRINNLYFQDGFRVIAIAVKPVDVSIEEIASKERTIFEDEMSFLG